jgi:hypothetical protein
MPHCKTITLSRYVKIGVRGRTEGFGVPPSDATFTYLTLGCINPVAQGPQRDARFSRWSVTGVGNRRKGWTLQNADQSYTHIAPPVL